MNAQPYNFTRATATAFNAAQLGAPTKQPISAVGVEVYRQCNPST